ncbi:hypothetical protein CEY04_05470 [Achromobacter sp. HZ28]|nr:hypothetical protein CEY05_05480 [Achromobacter sp. HZ34]OWT81338.1 hypothetical protein CEY04_05470 [Achromobacter sp. HZ28]
MLFWIGQFIRGGGESSTRAQEASECVMISHRPSFYFSYCNSQYQIGGAVPAWTEPIIQELQRAVDAI